MATPRHPYGTGKAHQRPGHVVVGAASLVMRAPMAAVVAYGLVTGLEVAAKLLAIQALPGTAKEALVRVKT